MLLKSSQLFHRSTYRHIDYNILTNKIMDSSNTTRLMSTPSIYKEIKRRDLFDKSTSSFKFNATSNLFDKSTSSFSKINGINKFPYNYNLAPRVPLSIQYERLFIPRCYIGTLFMLSITLMPPVLVPGMIPLTLIPLIIAPLFMIPILLVPFVLIVSVLGPIIIQIGS